jgi:omega-6 fatty acid desaturase (delta-12 desaturase)
VRELAVTVVLFAGGWFAMYVGWSHDAWWLYAAALAPTAGSLVRLFLLQHDCGHRSLFTSRSANDATGRALGVLTLTPYAHWRRAHAIHHATHGHLGKRGTGDVDTITVAEYRARGRWARLRYRLYRHPAVMFGVGPTFVFLLQNRVPAGFTRSGAAPWISTMGTNVAAAALVGLAVSVFGVGAFLAVHLPVLVLAATIGVWLFFVQHQFEHTYWEDASRWNACDAALSGSSHYDLPRVLRWFTANIGMHHLHHLSCRIPFYRFPEVARALPELASFNRIGFLEGFRCVRLALWDEERRRLVAFRDVRASEPVPAEFNRRSQ